MTSFVSRHTSLRHTLCDTHTERLYRVTHRNRITIEYHDTSARLLFVSKHFPTGLNAHALATSSSGPAVVMDVVNMPFIDNIIFQCVSYRGLFCLSGVITKSGPSLPYHAERSCERFWGKTTTRTFSKIISTPVSTPLCYPHGCPPRLHATTRTIGT